jgi:AcrR family transcriptional regulator
MSTSLPRTSLREAQKALTRSRLLDAAAELFVRQGYAATTIEEIATAAGATRATFYLHFSSKSDLVHGLYAALVEYDAEYAHLIEVCRDPSEAALRAWLDAFVAGLDSPANYWVALRLAGAADQEAREAAEQDFGRSASKLAAGLERVRGWEPDRAHLMAVVLKRQLDVCQDDWIRARWDRERGHLLDTLARMWSAALKER